MNQIKYELNLSNEFFYDITKGTGDKPYLIR